MLQYPAAARLVMTGCAPGRCARWVWRRRCSPPPTLLLAEQGSAPIFVLFCCRHPENACTPSCLNEEYFGVYPRLRNGRVKNNWVQMFLLVVSSKSSDMCLLENGRQRCRRQNGPSDDDAFICSTSRPYSCALCSCALVSRDATATPCPRRGFRGRPRSETPGPCAGPSR